MVEGNLGKLKGQIFEVNFTERVGDNVWHRGMIDGQRAWVHSSYLTTGTESKTSRLGHLRSSAKTIYKELGKESTGMNAEEYKNAVYYIKLQSEINGELFYLLSTSPSSTEGTVGWISANEVSSHTHNGTDKTRKAYFFTGNGKAYSKAWGGSKDLVFSDMTQFKDQVFEINLTENVGPYVWYRGKLEGKTIWLHSSYVSETATVNYNITLEKAVDIQMKVAPQTDAKYAYVSKDFIKDNKVTASTLNVRPSPNVNNTPVGTLKKGDTVKILSQPSNDWYQIEYQTSAGTWVHAARKDVKYYLDPKNFINDEKLRFQFLDLSKSTNASAKKLNEALIGKGILQGQGQAFIDAGNKHGINDLYLISHAFLETGNGTSKLAKGKEVGKDKSNNLTLVTNANRSNLKDIKKVYNMYGIGAYDNCAIECGAIYAYKMNWTTPSAAIIGGAEFIGTGYIKSGQNTLYKMRWNPLAMSNNGVPSHQYATDIGWAAKQVTTMYNLYRDFKIDSPTLEIPVYK